MTRLEQLDRLIRAESRETVRTSRRLRVLLLRQSQVAQAMDVRPCDLRRAKYLMGVSRFDLIRSEGLSDVAAKLRSAADEVSDCCAHRSGVFERGKERLSMSEPLGYSREGDVVTLRMTVEDWALLLIESGYAWSAASAKDKPLAREFISLTNRLNVGSPGFRPYDV